MCSRGLQVPISNLQTRIDIAIAQRLSSRKAQVAHSTWEGLHRNNEASNASLLSSSGLRLLHPTSTSLLDSTHVVLCCVLCVLYCVLFAVCCVCVCFFFFFFGCCFLFVNVVVDVDVDVVVNKSVVAVAVVVVVVVVVAAVDVTSVVGCCCCCCCCC